MQTTTWVPLFPEQASTFAWQVDLLYFYLIAVSIAFTIPIVVAIFFFAIKYRETEKYATPEEMHGSMVLETVWSIIPFVISMTIFLGGAIVFFEQYTPPDDAMEIYVVGKQWMWKAQHDFVDVRAMPIYAGSNEVMKIILARMMGLETRSPD